MLKHWKQAGLLACAVAVVASACGGGGDSSRPGSGQQDPTEMTGFVLEIGGAVDSTEVGVVITELEDALLSPDGAVDTLIVNGPNADVFASFPVPGTTPSGQLDTISKNKTARGRDVDELGAEIEAAVESVFETAVSFDEGRDIVGAVERIAARDPSRIVVVLTSGGVHRTSAVDFLADIPDPQRLDIDPDIELVILGVGDVPVPGGGVPSHEFTSGLIEYWQRVCELHGPKCEVVR